MDIDFTVKEYNLEFIIPAKTSRNVFTKKKHWIVSIYNKRNIEIKGIGEAAPLEFLSPDYNNELSEKITQFLYRLTKGEPFEEIDFTGFPSVKFAIESALIDLKNGGKQVYFNSDYIKGKPIPINGLIWMNDTESMLKEAIKKVESGFKCIKFKVGSLDIDKECKMLESFRNTQQGKNCIIRLDANGAFNHKNAFEILNELSRFNIHSIEQPIKTGQFDIMAKLCSESKIKIALDEELINLTNEKEIEKLFKIIKPHFVVLKPTLLGGLSNSMKWIKLSEKYNSNWWITSALESNIGLNILSQWVGNLKTNTFQGLGTGILYKNNFRKKSNIFNGELYYKG
ncbi:MAG: o-succinylbenzoate synthase [Bacteroidia bacterium]|nr:o-succinylbenzoate synthase [Bacteroidia bacterium]